MTRPRTALLPRTFRRGHGFSLIELVLALLLLSVAFAFANQVFMSSTVIKRDAMRAQHDLVQADSLLRLIRTDVWGSASIHSDRPGECSMRMPDGTQVRWVHELTRFNDEDEPESLIYRLETRYDVEVSGDPLFAPVDLAFEVRDEDLVVHTSDRAVRMVSLYQLIREARP